MRFSSASLPVHDVSISHAYFPAYFTTIALSTIILYSPEDVLEAFYSQVLSVYSLIVAAMITVIERNITRLHTVIATSLAGSPLSVYLLLYVLRSLMGRVTRLHGVFGPGKWINRILVLVMLPLWLTLTIIATLPPQKWHFQQSACDDLVSGNHIVKLFNLAVFVLVFYEKPAIGVFIVVPLVLAWGICIFLQRREIWKKHTIFPYRRIWCVSKQSSSIRCLLTPFRRKVVDNYPFIQFVSVVIFPHGIKSFSGVLALADDLSRQSSGF